MHSDTSLLEPSLAEGRQEQPIYSVRSQFFVAFFGGPFAVLAYSFLNSRLLDRAKKDLPLYLCAAVATVVLICWLTYVPEGENIKEWLAAKRKADPNLRHYPKALGLLIWGAVYGLHKPYHETLAHSGTEPLKPWKAAIGCILLGVLLQGGLAIGFVFLQAMR